MFYLFRMNDKAISRLDIRIDPQTKAFFHTVASQLKISISELLISQTIVSLEGKQFKKSFRKKVKDAQDELKLKQVREENTKIYHNLYVFKNILRRIIDFAKSSYFSTGKINMQVIRELINNGEKELKRIPKDIQKLIEPEMEEIRRFKQESYLENKLKEIERLVQK